jgi:anaerobic magnesium-protoporphyrin IX monomethyl ester cyclase
MKILLCAVHNPENMRIKAGAFGISPPLGLAYIARYLLEGGHEIKILDNNIQKLGKDQIKRYISAFKPDIVGITAYTFSIKECFFLAGWIKEVDKAIHVIFGGPHATYLPEETLSNGSVDIIVMGEGEQVMRDVVNCLQEKNELKNLKGVAYKTKDGRVTQREAAGLIEDLDSIPFPAYELLEMERYYSSVNRKFSGQRFGAIITSRGCPYECSFCSHKMFGKKVRFRSPANVVDELELLVKDYGIREFIFLDDTFTIDTPRAMKICELIRKKGLDIIWSCNSRADHASEELYIALRKAGCRSIHVGVESASQEMLISMKKGITIEQIERSVKLAKKHVGHVVCGFIFGMPGDSVKRAEETITFAKKLDPDYATFNIVIPVPGSQIFEEAVRKKLIHPEDEKWDGYLELFSPSLPVIELSEIKRKKLVALAKKAFRQFYFRPSYLLRRLRTVHSFSQVLELLKGVRAIINYEFTRI